MFHRPKFDRQDQTQTQSQGDTEIKSAATKLSKVDAQLASQPGQGAGETMGGVPQVPGFDVNIYAGAPAGQLAPQNAGGEPINATINASEMSERDDMQSENIQRENTQPGNTQPGNTQPENEAISANAPSMQGAEEQQIRHGFEANYEGTDAKEGGNQNATLQQPYIGGIGVSPGQSMGVEAGRELVVGKGISLNGEIQECNNLVVEGRVEAALKGAKILEIREEGTFIGAVEIEQATIAGVFEGEITVNGRLTITKTGSITGTIAYKELEIHAGAMVEGKIAPVSAPKFKSAKESTKESAKDDQAGKSSANKKASAKPRQEVELPL